MPDTPRRRLRAAAFRLVLPVLSAALAVLPWRATLAVGRGLGRALYAVNGRERCRMREHLALAYPELTATERERLAKRSAALHGANLAENLSLLVRRPVSILSRIEVVGWEGVEEARRSGRPLLFVTGHCGNWELLAAVVPAQGLTNYGFGREVRQSELNDAVVRLRERLGTRTITRGDRHSARRLREVLRGNAGLVMLIDQDTDVDGVFVPFFGRPAHTPTAAADLAGRHGMAVVPTFMHRLPDGRHQATFHPPETLPQDPTEATAHLTHHIESHIRTHPAQWVWMHRRWRRRPATEDA